MYAARAAKPKLSLSIAATTTSNTSRPVLSLKSPVAMSMPRTPLSPSPLSPTARNTKLNQRGFSSMSQQPTLAYANPTSSRGILKKSNSSSCSGASSKRIQFNVEPTVHCVTPIENTDDYYGGYVKMTRDERRWMLRS
ncbi:uncharacterized protein PADG_12338 [Paracoccidioides brasiliensis Pb18]|uniref:Uncharacterized protein n=1 Tax=Paracoccidioides brasiliensis (strain Pb18) TaxID=502780 RepID=A0A0A0HTC5_PARBD|nr:uncharacterized protein PADG_12338 [Paracoccidioides brasiliensis Pb18]KGM91563.1 hypothetical protein PADG_12338 [Paracoccidioides brasiliensis Pb18]ODH53700.1 hypothetical protein GX48_00118 [Paracoccidioides brasiliensis]